MEHEARIDGLTPTEAADLVNEWRQLGVTGIRTEPRADGRVNLFGTVHGSPFATPSAAEVSQPTPAIPPRAPPKVSSQTGFSALADEYRALFDACIPDPAKEAKIQAHLQKIRPGEMRYRALGQRLDIPWPFIAIIHSLECGCDFASHLHNGDPLSARTSRVPAGRPAAGSPPFTWEQSAEDALRMKGYVGQTDWSLAAMLFRWESYNGMGYRVRGLPTPYLWSFSNIYEGGLFVADHVFNSQAVSGQCGAAVLLKRLQAV